MPLKQHLGPIGALLRRNRSEATLSRPGRGGILLSASNIYRLGVKELWSLARDPILVALVIFSFTVTIYSTATAVPETLYQVSLAVVDEDTSPLSSRIINAFYPPRFLPPEMIDLRLMDQGMDTGRYTFVLNIPPEYQSDVLAGKAPELQLNVDATRMSQAFSGGGYIQQIVNDEVSEFVARYRAPANPPAALTSRNRFNPNLTSAWFGALMEIINNVTMLSIILTGAALIREKEHGTIEHLLVMPVTPTEIMLSKVWSMGLVVLVAAGLSLVLVVKGALGVPITGSVALFLCGAAMHLFATTSMGIFMATVARSMPQFGMLLILVLLPLQMLSGGSTPRESMPQGVQDIMLLAPTTHFVELSQGILYRGAGLDVVWTSFLFLLIIGGVFFGVSLARFRKAIVEMA